MIKSFTLLILTAVLLTSCSNQDAFNFNEDLIARGDSISNIVNSVDAKMTTFLIQNKMDSLELVTTNAEKKVIDLMLNIQNKPTPNVKGATDYKKAFINYLGYVKSLFSLYKYYSTAKTEESKADFLKRIEEKSAKNQEWYSYLVAAQAYYAKANNFRVSGGSINSKF